MPLRIAVTGATGFVGKALMPLLSMAGFEIAALVRNPQMAKLHGSVRVVQGNLQNLEALDALTRGADVVLHVAGAINGVTRGDFFTANVDGTLAVAQAARKNGVKHFILVSSLSAREPRLNFYGESKAAAEFALQGFVDDMKITIIRPSAVYGPGDKATLPLLKALTSSIALIPGTSTARFGMVHVEDVAGVLIKAAHQGVAGLFEIDDGSGGHRWAELVAITQETFGVPRKVFFIPRSFAMALGAAGDAIAKLRGKPSIVGRGQLRQIYHEDWRVAGAAWLHHNFIPLQQGLPDTIRWYQAQGLLPLRRSADRRPTHHDQTG